jgi:uncharacterized protein
MNRESLQAAVALASGALFGAGLLLGGMTDPNNVLGFLDVFGDWNPRLMFVMGGAILAHAPFNAWMLKRGAPLLAAKLLIPRRRDIDAALVAGAALFGVGWGLSGYCPGPSLVAVPSAHLGVVVFVAALIAGSGLQRVLSIATRRRQAA